jgi:hypothetical protein
MLNLAAAKVFLCVSGRSKAATHGRIKSSHLRRPRIAV